MTNFLKKLFGAPESGSADGQAAPDSSPPRAERREELTMSEARFRLLVEAVTDYAIFMLDPTGHIVSWNPGAERIKGYTAGEVLGRHFSIFYTAEDVATGKAERELATASSVGRYEEEGWRVRKDGTVFWASVVLTAVRGPGGELLGFAKVTRDLTERLAAREIEGLLAREAAARKAAEAGEREAQIAHREEHRQREQLRVTLSSIGDGVIVTDADGNCTFLNPVAEALTGWSAEQALGQPVARVFHIVNEDSRRTVESPVTRVLHEGVVVGLANHTVLIGRDAREIPIDDSGAPIRAEDGSLIGAVLVFRDVTETRRAVEVRMHLAAIVESSDDAIIGKNLDGIIVSWNQGAERLYGWTSEEIIGRPITTLLPPNQPDELPEIVKRLRRGERIEHLETTRVRKDGVPLQVSLTISPIKDSEGRVVGASKIARDITAQKRTEASLRVLAEASAALADLGDSESALGNVARLAVPAIADACVIDIAEPDGLLRRVVTAMSDAPGSSDLQVPADPSEDGGIARVVQTGMSELRSPAPEASTGAAQPQPASMSVPIRARGKILGVLSFLTTGSGRRFDGSDLRLAEDLANRVAAALDNARLFKEIRDADRRKDEFLAMLAHELRNPLAPIRTSLEVLRQSPGQGAAETARAIMQRQVQHLSRLVDDLLDVSRIMQGHIELRREPIELAGIVGAAIETARPMLDLRGQEVALSLPSEPVWLHADPTRMAQILSNLLNNAAKFSRGPAEVRVSARVEGSDVEIRIEDHGIGIDPSLLPHVFDLFVQGDPSLERSHGGLGIGLTVVRRLVQLHGGTIGIHSAGAARGTEVVLRLPIFERARRDGSLDRSESRSADSRRILVVDDSMDAAESTALLLQAWGHEVRVAHDGAGALQAAVDLRPEIVLLDIGLPGMSGYEVAKHLRLRDSSRDALIIAITGYGQDEDRRKALDAGFNRHLTKPVDPAMLRELISALPA